MIELKLEPPTSIQTLQPRPSHPGLEKVYTLQDLWDTFVKMRGELAPSSLTIYATVGKQFCAFMENRALGPISLMQWTQYLQDKRSTPRNGKPEKRLTTIVINKRNSFVRGFLRWLKTMNLIQTDLDRCVQSVHQPDAPKEVEIFTEEEYEKIKEFCTRESFQTHGWLITLSYRTGMSLKDCCYLRWQNVHINPNGHSYIDIHRIKTRRMGSKALCRIPLLPYSDLWDWLEKLKGQEPYKRHDGIPDYVHRDGPGLYECAFQRIGQDFITIFKRCGLPPGRTFHCFRRSFCSMLVNSNTNLALVCAMTGHNSVNMLLRYLQPDRRALQEAMERAVKTLGKPL